MNRREPRRGEQLLEKENMQTKTYTQVDYLRSAPSAQAQAVLTLMGNLNLPAQYLGRAPMPTEIVELEDWTIKPWLLDDTALPPVAWKPVVALGEAGIKPLGYVILHEKVKKPEVAQLPPPSKPAKPPIDWPAAWAKVREVGVAATPMLLAAAKTTAEVAVAAVKVMAVGTVMMLGLVATVLAADPVLVVVMAPDPDDPNQLPIWLELARWWDEEV